MSSSTLCYIFTLLLSLLSFFFFFNDTATTEIYTLSLHDALPISIWLLLRDAIAMIAAGTAIALPCVAALGRRSEEHTSELQSHLNLVCRLLLEKKKKKKKRGRDNSMGL